MTDNANPVEEISFGTCPTCGTSGQMIPGTDGREFAIRPVEETESSSPLVNFAREEMRRAGMWDHDVDYGKGEIADCVLRLVKTHSREGHSGGSAEMVLDVFEKVVRYKPLSPLTSDPDEWMDVGQNMWQSRRNPSCFSEDGGKTFYDIDEAGRPRHETAAPREKKS